MKTLFVAAIFAFVALSFVNPDTLFHWQEITHKFLNESYALLLSKVHAG